LSNRSEQQLKISKDLAVRDATCIDFSYIYAVVDKFDGFPERLPNRI
jgi:hypothetical protein